MLPINFSLNAVLILLLGAIFLIGGAYFIFTPWMRVLGFGMLSTALGCIFCGLTDGFADVTPRGIAFRKVGVVAFFIGVPVLAYSAYRMV
jgi:hypothetical protein